MKAKSITLAMLVLFSVALSAAAAGDPINNTGFIVIPIKGSEIYKVVYKGETENQGKMKLSLINSNAQVVFTETINVMSGFIRPLNFRGLEAGQYTIELVTANGKLVKKIDFAPQGSVIKYAHVSKMMSANGKYLLSVVSNKQSGDKVSVRIYNENGLIYDGSKEVTGDFAQVYHVKDATGSLTFEISDQRGTVTTTSF